MESVKKYLSDQHLHSTHSFDGKQTIEEACHRYEELGFSQICFTEHIEPGHPDPACDHPPIFSAWLEDIRSAGEHGKGMKIRAGLEVGDKLEERERTQRLLKTLPLDFCLLSLHLVNGVDCWSPAYYEGWTREEAYRAYAEAKAKSVMAWEDYDAVAHIGYCAKFAPYPMSERPLVWTDAPEELDALLKSVIDKGKCIEINTSGVGATGEVIPHPSILKRYIALGGEAFSFGTDAHDVRRDGEGIMDAMELAASLGGKYSAVFSKRKATYHKI